MPSIGDFISAYRNSRRSEPFYFTIQSQHLGFSEWISLFTLCFAPLIAHIFVGAPEPVVISKDPPRWIDRILHFNPTSIYWRYYAITIRRSRASTWGGDEAAPTNAIFWFRGKWDGSEHMMRESKRLNPVSPSRGPISLGSVMKTLLVTLQGIQAAYDLGKGLSLGGYALTVALPDIFRPLAIAGLFRLPASVWLTDDYIYATTEVLEEFQLLGQEQESACLTPPEWPKMRSQNCWQANLVKVFFLATTLALLVLALYYFNPNPRVTAGTASTLLMNILYTIFLLVTFVTTLAYTIWSKTDTTLIPCINSTWYKIYTYFLFSFALVVLICTALETRKTYCGQFTTYPVELGWDQYLC